MADIAMLAKMKPAFITQQLTLILCMKHLGGFNPQEQLDTYFQQQAIQSGKKVGGLETPYHKSTYCSIVKHCNARQICFTV